MNLKTLFAISLTSISLLATSCIKEEAMDREADIVSVTIEDKGFMTALINESNQKISLIVEGDISNYQSGIIVPTIKTSPNATVSPKSLIPTQLVNYGQSYTVTSEDGHSKTYSLSISPYAPLIQGFEEWHEITSSSKTYDIPGDEMWKNANQGVALAYRNNTPFPTRKSTDKYPKSEGKFSVELETVSGNPDGSGVLAIPIYAGNMYRGEFNLAIALDDPLATTKFGQPHPEYFGEPLALTAWYKYKVGDRYQTWVQNGNKKDIVYVDGKSDEADIYAILYKVPKGEAGRTTFLTARNIKTSEDIVAKALMKDTGEKDDWTLLNTKFIYSEKLDFQKHDYKLAVVLSSSTDGANYHGAIGSLLIVDDLRVVFANDPDAELYK